MGVPLSRRLSLDLTQMLRLILMLGTDTTEDTGDTMVDIIAHTVTVTMERDLLMLSPLPKPLPTLRPRLILGTDTTDTHTGHTDMDTMDTAHTDTMDTMERGLLMLSPLLMPLPMPALRLILGTDTTDTDTSQQQLAVSPCRLCCKTPVFAKQFSFCRKIVLFCVLGCRVLCSIICKSTKK